jgi:hypothetical protein
VVTTATPDSHWGDAVPAAFQCLVAEFHDAGAAYRCEAAMTICARVVERKGYRHEVRGVLSKETGPCGVLIGRNYTAEVGGNSSASTMTSRTHESRFSRHNMYKFDS